MGADYVLHPLIHTLIEFRLAQYVETKKAEPMTPLVLVLMALCLHFRISEVRMSLPLEALYLFFCLLWTYRRQTSRREDMSNQEKRGVSLWFLLVAVFVGLLSGFLVNNAKLVDKAKVDQRTTASQPSDFSRWTASERWKVTGSAHQSQGANGADWAPYQYQKSQKICESGLLLLSDCIVVFPVRLSDDEHIGKKSRG